MLVVDCGLGLESAEAVLGVARRLAPGRQIVLTVTHAHPKHGFGAQVFKRDARISYNRAQGDYCARAGEKLLAGFRADVLLPGQKQVLDGIVVTPPDQTYDGDRAALDLGCRRVEFRSWRTTHSPGDQVIHLPEERMFPIAPFFPLMIVPKDIDVARWEAALADVLRFEPRLVVPSHGSLGGAEVTNDVLGYFREVCAMVQAAVPSGSMLEQRIRDRYPTWEQSQFIPPAVR